MRSSSEIAAQIKVEKAKLREFQESLAELEAYIVQMQDLKNDINEISTSLDGNLKELVKKGISGSKGAKISGNVDKPVSSFKSAVSNLEGAIGVAKGNDRKWLKMSIHNKELQISELEREYNRALASEAEERASRAQASGGGGTPARNMLK